MLIVKKTKATLYLINFNCELSGCLTEICSVSLNSIILKEGVVKAKLYNLFFTAGYMVPIKPKSNGDKEESKKHGYETRKVTQEKSKPTFSENTTYIGDTFDHFEFANAKFK